MERMKNREHDFITKLRQASTIRRLREYIIWQRDRTKKPPDSGPVSINLDLTSACNFACPFCVDSALINTGGSLSLSEVKKAIDILHKKGLLSVILLGGGEPTLHKDFAEIVGHIKAKKLGLGIVTNGTRLDKVKEIAGLLKGKDWVRISLDAAKEETFKALHHPKVKVSLGEILKAAKGLKEKNPKVSLGYSFVIIWDLPSPADLPADPPSPSEVAGGLRRTEALAEGGAGFAKAGGVQINGKRLPPNIGQMPEATRLAREYSFDYISFKPCLVRLPDSQRESLLAGVGKNEEDDIREKIWINLQKAKTAGGNKIKILESVNLKAMLAGEANRIKQQPKRCHLQSFRTVVSPLGIFHCPAFRGVEKAKIAESDGYTSETKFQATQKMLARSIATFDASRECQVVGCFYHEVNWWIEDFINSKQDVTKIEAVEDDNFFL